ncbi:MAG TPA: hypothetical protein VGN19_13945 [Pedococcus sp.]|nr:hypothetical protein [Pedococcus sp.]
MSSTDHPPVARYRRGVSRTADGSPSIRALDALAVLVGLLVLTVGTIWCAMIGAWAAMVTLLPIGLSLVLIPARGSRNQAPSGGQA